jgi:hypothetical protein
MMSETKNSKADRSEYQSGRVGYFVLWMLGAPVGLLLLMWVILGNYIFGPG